MTEPKPWPRKAENNRIDTIALLLDFRVLQVQLEYANASGDQLEIAKLNRVMAEKREKAIQLLKEARTK